MSSKPRTLFWLESALAFLCAVLGVATVFSPSWIEALSGFDPDRGNGTFEWLIVAGIFAASGLAGLVARAEWRRPLRQASDSYVDL
jgi:hypothetical protein